MPWPGPKFMKTANMSQQKENKELFQPLFSKRPSTMHKNTRSKCRQVWTLQLRRGRGRAFENQTGPIKTWPGRLWEKPPESPPGRTMSFLVWLLQGHNGRYSLKHMPEMVRNLRKPAQRTRILSADRGREVDNERAQKREGCERSAVPRNLQCRRVVKWELEYGHFKWFIQP